MWHLKLRMLQKEEDAFLEPLDVQSQLTTRFNKRKADEARDMVLLNRMALITSWVTKSHENYSIWRAPQMTMKSYFHPLSKKVNVS